jgi:hypothetical protein
MADKGTFDCGHCGQGQLVRTHTPDLGCGVHGPRQRGQGCPIRGESPGMNSLLWSSRFPLANRSSLESYIMCGRQWNFQCTFMLNGLVLALVQSIYAYRCIKASSHVPSFPFPSPPLAPYWS